MKRLFLETLVFDSLETTTMDLFDLVEKRMWSKYVTIVEEEIARRYAKVREEAVLNSDQSVHQSLSDYITSRLQSDILIPLEETDPTKNPFYTKNLLTFDEKIDLLWRTVACRRKKSVWLAMKAFDLTF